MVWPITGAESYVWETGKSMKAVAMAVGQEDCWRNIASSAAIFSLSEESRGISPPQKPQEG
jgi:hypothetical protein